MAEKEIKRGIAFCVSRDRMKDRNLSYIVDGWFRVYGETGDKDVITMRREQACMTRLCLEANVGRQRAQKAVDEMFSRGELREVDGFMQVDRVPGVPFVSIPFYTARKAIAQLDERRMRCWLWAINRLGQAELHGKSTCTVYPVWLTRDLGLADANENTRNVKRAMDDLREKGLVKIKESGRAWEILEAKKVWR